MGKESKISALGSLDLQCPPLPQTMLEAMDLMQQQDGPQIDQVVKMVEHDPGVVARLLRVVNSAYYGQGGEIKNVSRAVLILGTVSVTGIVMSLGLNEVRNSLDERTTLPFLNLARHSLASAFIARHLVLHNSEKSTHTALKDHLGDVYTAALLHDFGKLILLYNHPGIASRIYGQKENDLTADHDLLKRERTWFGYDHVETGVYLTRRLRFPESLTTAIALHHRDGHLDKIAPEISQMIYVVKAANLAAHALGFSDVQKPDWEACSIDPLWSRMIDERVILYDDVESVLENLKEQVAEIEYYVETIS